MVSVVFVFVISCDTSKILTLMFKKFQRLLIY